MVVSGAQLLFKGVTYKGFHLNMLREEGRWDEMWSFITEAAKEGNGLKMVFAFIGMECP